MADIDLKKATDIQFPFPKEEELSHWGNFIENFDGWDPKTKVLYHIAVDEGSIDTGTTYTLTFKTQFGETIATKKGMSEGDMVTYPEDSDVPSHEGYTFSAWSQTITVMPAKNTTITAMYGINSYTLTYWASETESASTLVKYNAIINIPDAPEVEGYTFAGWVDEDEKSYERMPARDLVLYAYYEANPHVVTFSYLDAQAKTVSEKKDTYYNASVAELVPTIVDNPSDSKYQYKFNDWDPEITTGTTVPNEDITYTAQYDKTAQTYTLTYQWQSGDTKQTITAHTKSYGETITMDELPSDEGYTFSPWDKTINTMPDSNVTITTTKKANEYTITFKIDNVEQPDLAIKAEYKSKVTMPSPTKVGYTLSEWNPEYETMPLNGGVSNASWIAKDVTIIISGYDSIATKVGATVTLPSIEKEGHTVTWDDPTIVDNKYTVPATDDATIELTYTDKINQYKLYVNGIEADSKDYGTEIKVKDVVENEKYSGDSEYSDSSKYTLTFGGDATGLTQTLTMGTAGLSILYTATPVEYLAQYVDDDSTVIASAMTPYKANITLTAETPSRTGYDFDGWTGDTMTGTMPNHNITATATYKAHTHTITYSVSYVKGDEVVKEETSSDSYKYNEPITVKAIPDVEGYTTPTGWSKTLPTTMPDDNIEVEATYNAIKYNVYYRTSEGGDVLDSKQAYMGDPIPTTDYSETGSGYNIAWVEEGETTHTVMPASDISYYANRTKIPVTVEVLTKTEQEDGSFITTTAKTDTAVTWGEVYTLDKPTYDETVYTFAWDVTEPWTPAWSTEKYTVTGTLSLIKEATTIYYGAAAYDDITGATDNPAMLSSLTTGDTFPSTGKLNITVAKDANYETNYNLYNNEEEWDDAQWATYIQSISKNVVIIAPASINLDDYKPIKRVIETLDDNIIKGNSIKISGADYVVWYENHVENISGYNVNGYHPEDEDIDISITLTIK